MIRDLQGFKNLAGLERKFNIDIEPK